jgi:3-isopropylmalate/(R)-2-methylmalate dehydratase small subunit
MQPFTRHRGVAVPLDRVDVDTDQIIPKQYLKRIERTGFGEYLFNDWRYLPDGSPNPSFELNDPRYAGATILLTGRNFGCGSSREHAVWALQDFGIRAIIAPSFADIFYNNCLSVGLLPVKLPPEQVAILMRQAQGGAGHTLTVELTEKTITDANGASIPFEIDPFHRYRLLNGLDDIELTLQHEDEIADYERRVLEVPSLAS